MPKTKMKKKHTWKTKKEENVARELEVFVTTFEMAIPEENVGKMDFDVPRDKRLTTFSVRSGIRNTLRKHQKVNQTWMC